MKRRNICPVHYPLMLFIKVVLKFTLQRSSRTCFLTFRYFDLLHYFSRANIRARVTEREFYKMFMKIINQKYPNLFTSADCVVKSLMTFCGLFRISCYRCTSLVANDVACDVAPVMIADCRRQRWGLMAMLQRCFRTIR